MKFTTFAEWEDDTHDYRLHIEVTDSEDETDFEELECERRKFVAGKRTPWEPHKLTKEERELNDVELRIEEAIEKSIQCKR